MRSRDCILFVCLVSSFIVGRATAIPRAQADAQRTSIVSDEKAGVLRFMIDGNQVAYIDAHGFNVLDDIGYGGAITDYGQGEFRRRAAGAGDGR